jgi:predicted Zn-dependent protease
MKRIVQLVLSLVMLGIMTAGCAVNPVTGRRELSLVSPEQELKIGSEGYKAVIAEYGLYDDPALHAYVNEVGQKVARASHQPSLAWHFAVLDDPTVNAFAMPGGYIYVTRGILAHLNSEAQLAGVLGHEIGHVTHRHSAERITQQQLYGLGLGVASVFSQTVRRYGDLAQQGLGLLFLKYSRDDEVQADELGVAYSTGGGYDPREIPSTYAMLKRLGEQSGQRLPGFLSTHPDPGNREVTTAELARQAVKGKTGLLVNERAYVQRLDGLVFGSDPRQGYFVGDEYVHPTLRFQLTFPAGWKHEDTRAAVAAQEPGQQALMQLTLADADAGTLAPAAFVQQLSGRGTFTEVVGKAETIGGFAAWVGRASLPQQQGAALPAAAGYIRRADSLMFQILGRSQQPGDANDAKIYASLRSFRAVTDPARLTVRPDRVKVEKITTTATLEATLRTLGAAESLFKTDALLNNLETDETVMAGTLLKVVVPGKR